MTARPSRPPPKMTIMKQNVVTERVKNHVSSFHYPSLELRSDCGSITTSHLIPTAFLLQGFFQIPTAAAVNTTSVNTPSCPSTPSSASSTATSSPCLTATATAGRHSHLQTKSTPIRGPFVRFPLMVSLEPKPLVPQVSQLSDGGGRQHS